VTDRRSERKSFTGGTEKHSDLRLVWFELIAILWNDHSQTPDAEVYHSGHHILSHRTQTTKYDLPPSGLEPGSAPSFGRVDRSWGGQHPASDLVQADIRGGEFKTQVLILGEDIDSLAGHWLNGFGV